MAETVHAERDGAVATVTIDRPERLNALDGDALDRLAAVVEAAGRDADAVVLRGAGEEAFAVGADVRELVDATPAEAERLARRGQAATDALASAPAPVVAAIDGYCLGGGLELALACDLRVATERAILGLTEVDLGVTPCWGGTRRLPALVDDELARRLVFFGDRVDGADADQLGLVGEVVAHGELESRVADLADDLAERPGAALAAAKEGLNAGREPTERELAAERRAFASLFGTPAQRERMGAFLD